MSRPFYFEVGGRGLRDIIGLWNRQLSRSQRLLVFHCLLLLPVFFSISSVSWALDFGANKVRYHTDHHWKIIETEHFQIYYYEPCKILAEFTADIAEKDFVKTCQVFDYVPKTKIPLFVYSTPLEFEETNITPEILSEGVGGFTEVFKNRIAVPMDGSYHEFEKVVHHEMTHAFQYDLIYGEGWRSVNLFKAVFVPNWMMEGMAEWNAQHLDAQGEMVLRDAVLNDDVIPLRLMESFDHFPQVYTAYKESQSILDYVTQVYGQGKVVEIFKHMAANQQPDTAVKNVLGISLDELYNNWHFYMKSQAWSRISGMPAPEKYGEVLEKNVMKSAISPDGKKLAYLKRTELTVLRLEDKSKEVVLNKVFQTGGSGMAWSPDGRFLAFMAAENGEYKLYIYDFEKKSIRKCFTPDLPVVYSPSWSSDQKYLVFTGFDNITTDLYRYEVQTGKMDRLTNNRDNKTWAQYGPDGASLYFLNESGGIQEIQKVQLNSAGLPTGEPTVVGKNLGTITSLVVWPNHLFFTADLNRKIFNIFQTDLNGDNLTQLTNTYADVLSLSPDPIGQKFYVVSYQKGIESLYTFDTANLEKLKWPASTFLTMTNEFSYISNSFENASKIIAVHPVKESAKETDQAPGSDRDDPEIVQERKPPVHPPTSIPHLEITEASNIVQLQWPVSGAEEDSVESYRIYRSTSAGATFSYLGNTTNTRLGQYVDYDVQDNGSYFYYVTAVNKIGESDPSPLVEVHPNFKIAYEDYRFSLSPDILLFLAGYDSSFGFVGGGVVQLSDYLGDNRVGILGDTIPGVRTGIEANYEFSEWRTTIDLDYFYYQNYFNIYDLQSGNIVNQYRNNENGFTLNFSYPIDNSTRIEYGLGTQRFLGSPVYLQFNEGISNYNLNTDQWNVANFYRLSFVQDKRKATQFWPSSGYGLNFTLLHALPVLDSNVSFANLLFETDFFADFSFLNHLVWANRVIGMTSQGPNPQTFFIGDDAPFEAYFTTIRGYGGSTFFGSNLGLWNTELRYPLATNMNFIPEPLSFFLIKDVELAGFADMGVVANQLGDVPNSPVLSSIGTGIRFYTFLYQRALVEFRFDVAWRLDQSAPPSFHFNLAPMF